jgi:hypothetical protein
VLGVPGQTEQRGRHTVLGFMEDGLHREARRRHVRSGARPDRSRHLPVPSVWPLILELGHGAAEVRRAGPDRRVKQVLVWCRRERPVHRVGVGVVDEQLGDRLALEDAALITEEHLKLVHAMEVGSEFNPAVNSVHVHLGTLTLGFPGAEEDVTVEVLSFEALVLRLVEGYKTHGLPVLA